MKRLLTLTIIATLYLLITLLGAWLSTVESIEHCPFSDTARASDCR